MDISFLQSFSLQVSILVCSVALPTSRTSALGDVTSLCVLSYKCENVENERSKQFVSLRFSLRPSLLASLDHLITQRGGVIGIVLGIYLVSVSFRSCVRAGEAKLCERISEEAPSVPRANALENSFPFLFCFCFSYSDADRLLCFPWIK